MGPSKPKKRALSWATLKDLADGTHQSPESDLRKTISTPAFSQLLSPEAAVRAAGRWSVQSAEEDGNGRPSGHSSTYPGTLGYGSQTGSASQPAIGSRDVGALNALTAAAATGGGLNPLLFPLINLNMGVNMGMSIASLAAGGGMGGLVWGAKSAGYGGEEAGSSGTGTSRRSSTAELQEPGEEVRTPTGAWGGEMNDTESDVGPLSAISSAGDARIISDELDDVQDIGSTDMASESPLHGHPSVEPKEKGSLKRRFKSCPQFRESLLDDTANVTEFDAHPAMVATAPGVGISPQLDAMTRGSGTSGIARPLAPLAPSTSSETVLPQGLSAGVAGMTLANVSLVQQIAAAAAAAAAASVTHSNPPQGLPTDSMNAIATEMATANMRQGGPYQSATREGSTPGVPDPMVDWDSNNALLRSLATPGNVSAGVHSAAAHVAARAGSGRANIVAPRRGMKPVASCPNMGSLGIAPTANDERRTRRLERNRASARVRRQRKKDMADLYEKEVARLERGIQTLRLHVWGEGESLALAEALEMSDDRSGLAATALPRDTANDRDARRGEALSNVEDLLRDVSIWGLDTHSIMLMVEAQRSPYTSAAPASLSPATNGSASRTYQRRREAEVEGARDEVGQSSGGERKEGPPTPGRRLGQPLPKPLCTTRQMTSSIAAMARDTKGQQTAMSKRHEQGQESKEHHDELEDLRQVLRLSEDQEKELVNSFEKWKDDALIEQILFKIARALRLPGRLELPSLKETYKAFESLVSDEQLLKFHRWLDNSLPAMCALDERTYHNQEGDEACGRDPGGRAMLQDSMPRSECLELRGPGQVDGQCAGEDNAQMPLAEDASSTSFAEREMSNDVLGCRVPASREDRATRSCEYRNGSRDNADTVTLTSDRGSQHSECMHLLAMDQTP